MSCRDKAESEIISCKTCILFESLHCCERAPQNLSSLMDQHVLLLQEKLLEADSRREADLTRLRAEEAEYRAKERKRREEQQRLREEERIRFEEELRRREEDYQRRREEERALDEQRRQDEDERRQREQQRRLEEEERRRRDEERRRQEEDQRRQEERERWQRLFEEERKKHEEAMQAIKASASASASTPQQAAPSFPPQVAGAGLCTPGPQTPHVPPAADYLSHYRLVSSQNTIFQPLYLGNISPINYSSILIFTLLEVQ